jgi:DNA polymerase-1
LNPSRAGHDIADLSQELLGEAIEDSDPLIQSGRAAEAVLRIAPLLAPEIKEKELEKLLTQIELPLAGVLAKMEARGIALDRQALEELARSMEAELARLTKEIFGHSGEVFNINSPKQLSHILFEKLKLPVIKRTKTGASTDEEVLTRLAAGHPLPAKLLEFRELSKLRSTYVEALPKLIDPETGRLHTSFNQMVTATGRLSSSDPNLQNIPIRTALGRQIRKAFVPGDSSRLFLAADYSQVELRILAHLSRDAALLAAFGEGQDIHRVTAAEIFHLSPEKVSDQERSAAKTINFGIVYGMTPFGLAKELRMGPREAEDFIDRYFQRYPGVKRYLELSLEEARKKGYVTTLMNRRRYIPELASPDLAVRQFAERTAVNAPIQGSAADLLKAAMVALDARLEAEGFSAGMLLTVHDELVFEVAQGECRRLESLVKKTMESPLWEGRPLKLLVPLSVKIKTGRNWLEASHG